METSVTAETNHQSLRGRGRPKRGLDGKKKMRQDPQILDLEGRLDLTNRLGENAGGSGGRFPTWKPGKN